MLRKLLPCYLLLLFIAASCSNATYEKYDKDTLVNFTWHKGQEIVFTPTIEDTSQTYTLALALRHVYGLPLNTVGVTVKSIAPSGKESTSTYELRIKESDLKYNSSCAGDICDFEAIVNNKLVFEEAGEYTYIVTHNVNADMIQGILEVGLIINEQ